MARVSRAKGVASGSLVFAHSDSLIGRAIRLGERIRGRPGDFWNHVAIVATKLPTGDWTVIEAVGRGVVVGRLSAIAPGGSYAVARVPGAEPARVVAFAKSQVGREYGWLTILSVVVGILTPRWFHLPSFRTDRSWICSALGGEAARFGGWLHDWPTVYGVLPSELFAAIVAKAG